MASSKTTTSTSWVSPRTWTAGELVTATIMNAHVRDQLTALKSPAYFRCVIDEASNYTTTSTSFTDVDATNLSATITTAGGNVLVGFTCVVDNNGANYNYLNLDVDGATVVGDDGLVVTQEGAAGERQQAVFTFLVTGLSAGSHTFKLQWKVSAGTATLYAGAGTANLDIHPTFWGIEAA